MQLFDDIKTQRKQFVVRLRQLALFLLFVFMLDRLFSTILLHGMDQYYGITDPAQILLVGYSHMVLGADKVFLERELEAPVAKYARAGATLRDREIMIKHYQSHNSKSVRIVVYGVDAHLFTPEGLSSNSYRLFYPHMNNPVVLPYLRDRALSLDEYYLRYASHMTRYSDVTLGIAIRGYMRDWSNYKHGSVNIEKLKMEVREGKYRRIKFASEQIDIFRRTISHLRNNGIVVLLAYIPTLDIYNTIEPEKYSQAIALFKETAANDSGIHFMNLNPQYSSRHELFRDPVHMNAAGQKQITNELIGRLKTLLKGMPE